MPVKLRHLLMFVIAVILSTGLTSRGVEPASAHTRVEIGPYVVVIGWTQEPVIVGERNALLIEVTRDEVPVEGLEASLDIQVLYAGRTFVGNLSPSPETPGLYLVPIYPTVRGQYQVHLTGLIEETEVDRIVEPEEVLSPGVLQFPEVQPELTSLQATIGELESQLQTAHTLAIAGVIVGLLGLAAAVVSLLRRPKAT